MFYNSYGHSHDAKGVEEMVHVIRAKTITASLPYVEHSIVITVNCFCPLSESAILNSFWFGLCLHVSIYFQKSLYLINKCKKISFFKTVHLYEKAKEEWICGPDAQVLRII